MTASPFNYFNPPDRAAISINGVSNAIDPRRLARATALLQYIPMPNIATTAFWPELSLRDVRGEQFRYRDAKADPQLRHKRWSGIRSVRRGGAAVQRRRRTAFAEQYHFGLNVAQLEQPGESIPSLAEANGNARAERQRGLV